MINKNFNLFFSAKINSALCFANKFCSLFFEAKAKIVLMLAIASLITPVISCFLLVAKAERWANFFLLTKQIGNNTTSHSISKIASLICTKNNITSEIIIRKTKIIIWKQNKSCICKKLVCMPTILLAILPDKLFWKYRNCRLMIILKAFSTIVASIFGCEW